VAIFPRSGTRGFFHFGQLFFQLSADCWASGSDIKLTKRLTGNFFESAVYSPCTGRRVKS
jgi:hypothetical protein